MLKNFSGLQIINNSSYMKINIRILLLFTFGFILSSCSNNNDNTKPEYKTQISRQEIFEPADTGNLICVSFKNESEKSVKLSFSINDKFWFSPHKMIEYIKEYKADSLPNTDILIAKAYNFVVNNTTHYEEYTMPRRFEYSPSILLNSLGLGICDNRGAVLAHILKEMGFESRCVHLWGHVVAEVYDKGKWKMLDADYDSYFLLNGEIASSKEIELDNMDCNLITGYHSNDLSFYFFPSTYLSFFTSEENNEVQYWYMQDVYWKDDYFTLPAQSELRFPVNNPNRNNRELYSYGKLTIKNLKKSYINIPFVVHSISGKGSLLNPFQGYVSEKSNCNFFTPGYYWVDADSLEVYFYINPHLIKRENYNDKIKLIYTISDSLEIKTEISLGFVKILPKPIFKNYEDLINTNQSKYETAFKELPEYHFEEIEFLSKEDIIVTISDFYKEIYPDDT
jgi:hypothetical protein